MSIFIKQTPVPAAPILGREKELEELMDLLKKHQVVTITGAGGIGKTRVSLEICHQANPEFEDGIVFVTMATLTDAREVMSTLADALGVTEAASRNLAEGVSNVLADKKALLVLDNLEHVISAGHEISELAATCSNLRILCTSRSPLKIQAEQEYALSPLALPIYTESKPLLEYAAIKLLVSRAQKVNKNFEFSPDNSSDITEICCRLDGLPLAIELAAARLRFLTPKQLLQHLGKALDLLSTGPKDAPARHQTLRATINWSHTLLNEQEQQLFRRLGVFARGFTLEAIEAICYESEQNTITAIDEVESLLEKGLVNKMDNEGRFTLLQTIKDFAMEKLVAASEDDLIFHRHAHYFSNFSILLAEGTKGYRQNERMKQGLLEEGNTAVALDYLVKKARRGDSAARELGLTICGELWMYWHIRGKHNSSKMYTNAFLEDTNDEDPGIARCEALFCLHISTFTLGEVDQSLNAAFRLFTMAGILKNDLLLAKGLFALGFGHLSVDPGLARQYSERTVALSRKLTDEYWLGLALWQNGLFNLINGELEKAKTGYSESLRLFQKIGDNEGKGCAQSGLSMLEFVAGNYSKANELYQDTLLAFQTVGDRPEQARVLYEMSWVYLATKDSNTALKHILDSIRVHQEAGSNRGIGLSMNGLAAVLAVKGYPVQAVEIAAAAQQFATQKGVAIEFGVSNHGKVYLDQAKQKLSASENERAEKLGRTYSLNDVLKIVENDFSLGKIVERQSVEDTFICKLEEAIAANFADSEFGVNQLYEAVSMSQMQVYRKLKALNQQTPSEFIRLYRLQKGRELLKTTDKTIAEIAYGVGFTDPNYFSRAFQKEYNQSPKEYRN